MTSSDSPDPPSAIIGVGVVNIATTSVSASAQVRTGFALQHLLVAARLAREVAATEAENAGRPLGEFFDVVLGSSVASVVLSTASLEAYINEVFADRVMHFSAHDQAILEMLWQEFDQKSVLDKFDLGLRLRGGTLDRGSATAQSVDRLIRLRNALTHFKPEWDDEADKHARLTRQLEGYASKSPWLRNEPLFPKAWATAGTTAWAVETVVGFVAAFSAATGLEDRLVKHSDRLGTKVANLK